MSYLEKINFYGTEYTLGVEPDSTPTSGSTKPITSDAVYGLKEDFGASLANFASGYFTPASVGTGNVSRDDGTIVSSSYLHSDYIDISGYSKLTTQATQASDFNAFYDSSKTFVSAFSVTAGADRTITIPDDAVYMRVSASSSKYADTFIFETLAKDNGDKISDLSDTVSTLADQTVYIPLIAGTGNISRDDGTVVTNSSYSYSDYIDISGYDELTTNAVYGSAFNVFYDSDKTFLEAFSVTAGTDQTITIPDDAVYMRVSNSTAKFNDTYVFRSLAKSNAVRIVELESIVNGIVGDYFVPEIASTGYISNNDGSEQSNANYSRSDYVDISLFGKLVVSSSYDSAFNAFYDSGKTFISSFTVRTGTDAVITIPDNAVYMRVSASTSKYADTFQFKSLVYDNAVKIADLEDAIDGLSGLSTDYFVPPIAGTGNISRDDGTVVTNANYSYSDYVDISDFDVLTTNATHDGNFNAFYNSSKTFISAFTVRAGTDLTLDIPDNAVYMRVSTGTSNYATTYVFKSLSHSNATRIATLENSVDGLLSGDSSYFAPPVAGNGNISRDDGTITSSNYYHSDYIDISQFPKLLSVAEYDGAFNAFYDANKTFIEAFSIVAGTDKIIEIPDGAMYMRVSGSQTKYADTMIFRTLEYVTSDILPDYWFKNITDKCDAVREHMNNIGKKGDTFVFVTDIHWYRNQQMSPKLIRYLLNHLNINMVALGGDLITQGTKAVEIIETLKCVKAFRFNDTFVPIAFGNHDNDSNQDDATQIFDVNTIYSLIFKAFEDNVTFMTDTEFSFYFDKTANKTRYIFLDMGDDGVSKAFTAYAEFRDAMLSTPSGYKIVIVAHIIDYGTFTTSLTSMIDAYNARSTVTVNSVVCDFTNGTGSVILCLGGHRHYDDVIATSGGVPITVTDCDALLSNQYEETEGTITEQCFDVVSTDYTNMIAYYERVGKGESRIIHLTPVSASTTLTTTLTGTITWSSSNNTIATVSNGTITRVTTGTVTIKADNGTTAEIWVCNS